MPTRSASSPMSTNRPGCSRATTPWRCPRGARPRWCASWRWPTRPTGAARRWSTGPRSPPPCAAFPRCRPPRTGSTTPASSRRWERVFGEGTVELRGYTPARFQGAGLIDEVRDMLGIDGQHRQGAGGAGRARRLGGHAGALAADERGLRAACSRPAARSRASSGPGCSARSRSTATRSIPAASAICRTGSSPKTPRSPPAHPKIGNALTPPPPARPFVEADPRFGFRATQYAAAFLPRIDQATKEARRAAEEARKRREQGAAEGADRLTPTAEKILSPRAKENFHALRTGRFAPHNRLGRVNEEELAAAFHRGADAAAARGQLRQRHRRLHEERGALHPRMGRLPPDDRGRQFPDLHQRLHRRHRRAARPAAGARDRPAPRQRRLAGQLAAAARARHSR